MKTTTLLRFLENSEIDREKWNACVRNSLYPTVFADYDFLTYASPTWGAVVESDYERVMPLPYRSKFGVKYVFTPYGFVRLGIFSHTQLSNSDIVRFVNAIPRHFVQVDLFMNPITSYESVSRFSVEMVSHMLDLSEDYDSLRKNFSTNMKRNINHSRKCGLSLVENVSIASIIGLFCKNKGKEAHILNNRADYHSFEKFAEYADSKGMLEVLGVQDEEKHLVAGALFLKDFSTYRLWFSGRDFSYSHCRPMFFLMDEFLRKHQQEPALFDFDGSRDENVSRFYRGFGGERYTFPMLNRTKNRCFASFLQLYRKFRQFIGRDKR